MPSSTATGDPAEETAIWRSCARLFTRSVAGFSLRFRARTLGRLGSLFATLKTLTQNDRSEQIDRTELTDHAALAGEPRVVQLEALQEP